MAIINEIKITKVTSTDLNLCTTILPDQIPAFGKIGAKTYLVVGDGTTQVMSLPKFAADQLAEWGSITGTISAQTDLANLFAGKLDKNLGAANAGKILVVDESGEVVLTVNNFMEKPASATAGNIGVFDANKNMVDGGKKLSDYYTKDETDDAIAASSVKVFNTNEDWETDDLETLNSWITGGTAHDPVNDRDIENYDVYATTDPEAQYYFDSGAWFPFNADMSNYYTKSETDNLLDGKISKPSTATANNIAVFNASKEVVDSGKSFSDISTDISGKVAIAQGAENANKVMGTDASGNVVPITVIDGGTI